MEEKLWKLYQVCFPDTVRSEKTARAVLALPENLIFREEAGGTLLGAAVLNGNTVLLLAVLPGYRRRGIATRMVRLGTGYLQAQGLARGFLGYTYTDIVPMYARRGYQVCQKYLMGKKKLT